jgi:GTPase
MGKEQFLHLQHSEAVVAGMSATIFAAFIRTRAVTDANEDALLDKAVNLAAKLAYRSEQYIKSDQEWVPREGGSSYLGG